MNNHDIKYDTVQKISNIFFDINTNNPFPLKGWGRHRPIFKVCQILAI